MRLDICYVIIITRGRNQNLLPKNAFVINFKYCTNLAQKSSFGLKIP